MNHNRFGRSMRWHVVAAVAVLAAQTAGTSAMAQRTDTAAAPTNGEPKADEITPAVIDARMKEAEASKDLDDETKKKIATLYQQALADLKRADELTAQAVDFEKSADTAPQRADEIRRQLEALKTRTPSVPPNTTLAELEQELARQELKVAELKAALASAEAEPRNRAGRRKEIRAQLFSVPTRMAEIQSQLNTSPPPDEPAPLTTARRIQLLARHKAVENETPALQNTLAMYDAEDSVDLVRLGRDLQSQLLAVEEQQLKLLDERVKQLRADKARQAVLRAREEAIAAQPLLRPYAERNRELAEAARTITSLVEQADRSLKQSRAQLEALKQQFQQTKEKVQSVGLTGAIGLMLRKQRAELPDLRRRGSDFSARREQIDDVQYELLVYDDERAQLSDIDAEVQKILAASEVQLNDAEREQLEQAARDLLGHRRDYLDALLRNYDTYFDTLVELDNTQEELIKVTNEYADYVEERVLWIRSAKPLTYDLQLEEADLLLFGRQRWADVGRGLVDDARDNAPIYVAALLAFGMLLRWRRRLRRELAEIEELASRRAFCQFTPTLRAALATLLLAVPWAGVVAFAAWRISNVTTPDDFAKVIAAGLLYTIFVFFPLEVFRQSWRPHGLAEAHFEWPRSAVRIFRRNLRWLIPCGVPLVFVTAALYSGDPYHGQDALERVCFMLLMLLFAVFLWRVLRPDGGVWHELVAYHPGGWTDRLKHLWFWLGLLSPLVLAVLAFTGHYYTARQLFWRMYATLFLIIGLVVLRAFVRRWLMLRRRKLALDQARERLKAAADAGSSAESPPPPAGVQTEQPAIDLHAVNRQTQQLLTTGLLATAVIGLWLIWVDVLPALRMFDRWPLWPTTVQVVETVDGDELQPAQTRVVETLEYVTIADVALALLVAILTFVAARNIPGLLEITLLEQLPIDAASRYAINRLTSYAIVLLGVVISCSTIGLQWSQIQWLATALTFGLAFGLQEMFANFVSGLIILFERPIRVGDIVTVDDVSGVVTRVRIRATTITNWDRKEFIVPNKEFITGRLLNWTLSDQVNRVVVNVGVAYGSDTERARELMLRIVDEHPLILKEPKSLVTFEGFGDSTLNLVLRTYLPNMENRLQVVHDLHTRIHDEFAKAQIEIAFPQRDLHIRSMPESLGVPAAVPAKSDGAPKNTEKQRV